MFINEEGADNDFHHWSSIIGKAPKKQGKINLIYCIIESSVAQTTNEKRKYEKPLLKKNCFWCGEGLKLKLQKFDMNKSKFFRTVEKLKLKS